MVDPGFGLHCRRMLRVLPSQAGGFGFFAEPDRELARICFRVRPLAESP